MTVASSNPRLTTRVNGGGTLVTLIGDWTTRDDDGAAAEGAVPDGVGAEVEFELAEADAGVVVVAEGFGEAEDVAVEG